MVPSRHFNRKSGHLREVALDVQSTGLRVSDGHRVIEIGVVEMLDGRETGREFHALLDPERDIPPESTKLHGIRAENVAGKPLFSSIARELRAFIGDDPVVITCRSVDGYTSDVALINMELEKAGEAKIPDAQWVNVRRWSEAMFGDKGASLNKVLDRYGIPHKGRDDKRGRSAMPDARFLSDVYLSLQKDHAAFLDKQAARAKKKKKLEP